jgi:pimeloyl-ACP methyl ester carboxylesterase
MDRSLRVQTGDGAAVAAELRHADGPAVLLVHGLGYSGRYWRRQVSALADAGYAVLVPDLRGFGASDASPVPYGMATLADDLERVRDAAGIDRFHLVGHSMGGMVALEYVLARPERVRSLALCSVSAHSGNRAAAFARAMALLSTEGFDAFTADPGNRAEVEAIVKVIAPYVGPVMDLLRSLTRTPDAARALAWQAIAGFSVKDRVAEIACPALIVHGSADPNIPFAAGRALAEAIRGSEWLAIDDAGHDIPLDHADAFDERLLAFLQRG